MYSLDEIKFSQKEITGLSTRIASVGQGPTVLLIHGWPECWYSWRSQMLALANAGFTAVAPDMPGFAGTDSRPDIDDYSIQQTSEFILALISSFSNGPVILVGHDWGAINVWNFTLRHPKAVSQLIALSVPLRTHGKAPPTEVLAERFSKRFFYQLYFQTPPIAEAEFDANPRAILSRLYASPNTPRTAPLLKQVPPEQGGWIDRLGELTERPSWLAQEDLDYFVDAYSQAGFAGGINYYRNIDKNWQLMAPYAETKIECPVLFVAGSEDVTLMSMNESQLSEMMKPRVSNLKTKLYFGYGHWIQQEYSEQVNVDLIEFIHSH